MATYTVKVSVDFEYQVECDNETEATDAGWNWEDHIQHGEVYCIDVAEHTEDNEGVYVS